ncbi:MAG TPA: energy transducer TonB [Candidatus Angelobacter sp.]
MFEHPKQPGRARLGFSQIGSIAVHVVVLALLCLRPAPIFVKPAIIAHGERGTSPLIYLAAPGEQEVLVAKQSKPRPAQIHLPVPVKKEFNAKVNSEKDAAPQNAETVSSTTSGSPESSDLNGVTMEPGVKPAIEVTLVDPPVRRSDIPPGVEGDVVVEITIDEQGNVIGAKLLKGLGPGIDEKIIATVLNNWHYRPATKYGVPIPSKYDAHWHFRG